MFIGKNLSRLIYGEGQSKTASSPDMPSPKDVSDGLSKIASMNHIGESAVSSITEVAKVASQCIDTLQTKVLELEKSAEIRVIVDDMIQNGVTDELDVVEKIAELKGKTNGELSVVKEAVKMATFIGSGGDLFQVNNENASSTHTRKKSMFEGLIK